MKKSLMLAAILIVGTSMAAMGEEIITQKLKETVISAENFETSVLDTAKNVTIVTQEDIQNKGANTVAEALKGVPGLTVSYMDGAEPKFDLRGYGATASENTIILIDGIPLNNIQGSGYYTSQIPVDMIDKIEVIPSGGAVMYGDGGTGGVINIITKSPENKSNYGSVGLEYGSWGTVKGTLNYGTKITDRFLINGAYNGYRSEGFRDKAEGKYDKDDKKESIWLRGKYLLDNGSIEGNYKHNKFKDYYTGALTKDQFKEDPSMAGSYNGIADSIEDSYTLKYSQRINEKLDFVVFGGYEELEYKGDSPLMKTHYLASQYYIKPQIKYNYGENSYIILGGDYKDGKSEDKLTPSNRDQKRESYAGYILNKTTIGDWQFTQGYRREKLNYDAGVREEYQGKVVREAKDQTADSYELGFNYLYSDTGSVYLNYTNGYRAPSIQELGVWYGELEVQESETYELGIKDVYGNTYISSSLFFTTTNNEIYYDGIVLNTNRNFNGEIERKGIQLSIQHYFDKLTLRENVSYVKSEIKDGISKGNEFPGVPKWTVNLGATYNFTEKLLGNIDMYYQSAAYGSADFQNNFGKNNEYTTVDTNIRYNFDNGLEIYGGIKNIFDEEYCNSFIGYGSYYPADGRSFYAGFKYNF